ncbi:MAG: sensor histidine kinase [Gemmatimonadota bacterium]
MKKRLPTALSLRMRLLGGLLILVFVALFTVSVTVYIGFAVELPPEFLGIAVAAVIVFDMLAVYLVAEHRLSRFVLEPLDAMVEGAERIAAGQHRHRLEGSDTVELERLAAAMNAMASSLIRNQQELARNVASLDATNRELSEARMRLVRSEKLASIGRLAAGIAHEVGNPLGAIIGYTALGQRELGSDSEWLSGIEYEARRIDRIVRGLLDFARPRAASRQLVDINEVARRTVTMLSLQGRFRQIEIEMALDEDLADVRGDGHQLEQVLVNLLLNAADAIGEAGPGRIRIRTSLVTIDREPDEGVVRRETDPTGIDYSHLRRLESAMDPGPQPLLERGAAAVELIVDDDGPGIPDEIRPRLFEPFFTTKDPGTGTGLGLAVSARLIEGMGGTIEVTSSDLGGAAFRLLLPTDAEREPASA